MDEGGYSEQVWTTLMWEFTRFADEQSNQPNLISDSASIQREAGIKVEESWELAAPEIRRAIRTITPVLFLEFLRQNQEILGTDDLLKWAADKHAKYPFP